MKIPFFFRLLLLSAIVAACAACGGAADTPVSFQIPFSGALTNDSTVVVIDGSSLGGNPVGGISSSQLTLKSQQLEPQPGCTSFPGGDDNANAVEFQLCQNTAPVVSNDVVAPIPGRRDHFSMLVRGLDHGDIVTAEAEVFDYPYMDDTICPGGNCDTFCPGDTCELRSGILSGHFQFGIVPPPVEELADGLLTFKYVAISKLEGGIKTFFHVNHGVSVIDGLEPGTILSEPRHPGDLGTILPTLFENQPLEFHIPNGFGWQLFKQGDIENPAGFIEFTFSNPPPVATPDGIHIFLDGKVSRGDNCHCDLCTEAEKKNGCDDRQKIQQCHDNPATGTPFDCQNLSSVKVTHLEKFLYPIEEKNSLFTDGKPFSVSGSKHDLINCETDTTGDYKTECLAAQAAGRIMKLNYRCEIIVIFDAMGKFVDLSRSLAGAFVFSIEKP
jgi:hypothetical protein